MKQRALYVRARAEGGGGGEIGGKKDKIDFAAFIKNAMNILVA
jgi:hypothetical protein